MYRWHSTLSQPDTKWVENKFHELFPNKDLGQVRCLPCITSRNPELMFIIADKERFLSTVRCVRESGGRQDVDFRRVCAIYLFCFSPSITVCTSLKRSKDTGRFDNGTHRTLICLLVLTVSIPASLAKILHDATDASASAFKARGIPEAMRVVEMMGIEQARKWGTCSVSLSTAVCLVLS